jgi:hypothetical protein
VTAFVALVLLSLRDLARRRLLWGVVLLLLGGLGLSYWARRLMEDMLELGASYDVATHRAAQTLESVASTLRLSTVFAVILVAAIVAPESRRIGTTQFVLASGVGRRAHAASQFVALAALVTAGTLVLHGGYFAALARLGTVSAAEAGLSWALLLLPLLAAAAAVFSMSLTLSTIETLLLFLAAPFALDVAILGASSLASHPWLWLVRLLESARLLFPNPADATPWPHLSFADPSQRPPVPESFWPAAHTLLAAAFWTGWGLLALRRHDFGSRTAIK